jgi:adenylate cyclase
MGQKGRNKGKSFVALVKRLAWQYGALLAVFFIGALLSCAAFAVARQWQNKRIESDLREAGENHAFALGRTLDRHAMVLKALDGFYAASENVTRDEFARISEPFLSRLPGIRSLEWIPRMQGAALDGFNEKKAAAGLGVTETAAKRLSEGSEDIESFPIFFVAPMAGNAHKLFLDLADNPALLAALNVARDSGDASATARIGLDGEDTEQLGF